MPILAYMTFFYALTFLFAGGARCKCHQQIKRWVRKRRLATPDYEEPSTAISRANKEDKEVMTSCNRSAAIAALTANGLCAFPFLVGKRVFHLVLETTILIYVVFQIKLAKFPMASIVHSLLLCDEVALRRRPLAFHENCRFTKNFLMKYLFSRIYWFLRKFNTTKLCRCTVSVIAWAITKLLYSEVLKINSKIYWSLRWEQSQL